jgi:hypothetical protein
MTLRIETVFVRGRPVVRLIGRLQSEHLGNIEAQLKGANPRPALDLEEVTLVNIEVVRFLTACEQHGIELLHCAPYIRHWMAREQSAKGDG